MGAARKLQLEQDDLSVRLGEPAQLAAVRGTSSIMREVFWGRHPVVSSWSDLCRCWWAIWLATVFSLTGFGMGLNYVV